MYTFISQLHLRSTLPLSKDFWYCVVKIVGTFQSLKPFLQHCSIPNIVWTSYLKLYNHYYSYHFVRVHVPFNKYIKCNLFFFFRQCMNKINIHNLVENLLYQPSYKSIENSDIDYSDSTCEFMYILVTFIFGKS